MNYHRNKNKLNILIIAVMLLLTSCNSQANNFSSNKIINKEVNFRDGSTIEIDISNIFKFKTKSNDSTPEATLEDIKSFSAFDDISEGRFLISSKKVYKNQI